MSHTVYAVVDNAIQAEIMVERLHLNGFSPDGIAVRSSESEGIADVLAGLGLTEEKIGRFEAKIEAGGILISAYTASPEETELARRIFQETCLKHVAPSEEREAVLV